MLYHFKGSLFVSFLRVSLRHWKGFFVHIIFLLFHKLISKMVEPGFKESQSENHFFIIVYSIKNQIKRKTIAKREYPSKVNLYLMVLYFYEFNFIPIG